MRCKNCDWENEPGVPKCSKCNARLDDSMADAAKSYDFHDKENVYEVDKATSDSPARHGGSNNSRQALLIAAGIIIAVLLAIILPSTCNRAVPEEVIDSTMTVEESPVEEEVVPLNSYISEHEYVDLGLSVMWATCNVGAAKPEEYGDYFAWGETTPKSEYTEDNCETHGDESIENIVGDSRYDAARANWGGSWRLPTDAEREELVNNCTHEWTTQNGVEGLLFTSKKNGKSIFLPAAGYRRDSSLYHSGEGGYYWCATLNNSNRWSASYLYFRGGNANWSWNYRYYGNSVRPVLKIGEDTMIAGIEEDTMIVGIEEDTMIAGHEYVDLGLSVLWATCNVGASSPEDTGYYYAWGETKPKSEYTMDNSVTYGKTSIGNIAGDLRYDAARANWGGSWRMPTETEILELLENCTHEWTTQNGVKGQLFTSKKNGKSIFLPAVGYRSGSSFHDVGDKGYYWGASSSEINSYGAYNINFRDNFADGTWNHRFLGRSVRPVSRIEKITMIAGHEYVDLGLSVKWATCNVGSSSPGGYGNYYAWGETKPKKEYTEDNSVTRGKASIGNIAGNSSYDVARANWGGSWRMPTKEEMKELLENCTHKWTSRNGVTGRLFTSKKNGKSIFLPAAGHCYRMRYYYTGEAGYYWSATPNEYDSDRAYHLGFSRGTASMGDWGRGYGHRVRPVTE